MACWGTVVVRWAQEGENKRFSGSNLNTVQAIDKENHPVHIKLFEQFLTNP